MKDIEERLAELDKALNYLTFLVVIQVAATIFGLMILTGAI